MPAKKVYFFLLLLSTYVFVCSPFTQGDEFDPHRTPVLQFFSIDNFSLSLQFLTDYAIPIFCLLLIIVPAVSLRPCAVYSGRCLSD